MSLLARDRLAPPRASLVESVLPQPGGPGPQARLPFPEARRTPRPLSTLEMLSSDPGLAVKGPPGPNDLEDRLHAARAHDAGILQDEAGEQEDEGLLPDLFMEDERGPAI